MYRSTLIILFILIATASAHAGQSEAREVARINNCSPKKIDVYQSQLGATGKVIYQVTCNLPKTTDKDSAGAPDSLLISCDQALCQMLRPLAADKK